MQPLTLLAGAVVAISALYLLGFGTIAVAEPQCAFGYLKHFASTLRLHVLELLVRLAVGAAFVGYASHMHFASAFLAFGAVLVITTLALAVIPWRWHQRIAQTSVPAVAPYLRLIGIASLAFGAFVLWALAAGVTERDATRRSGWSAPQPVGVRQRPAEPIAAGDVRPAIAPE